MAKDLPGMPLLHERALQWHREYNSAPVIRLYLLALCYSHVYHVGITYCASAACFDGSGIGACICAVFAGTTDAHAVCALLCSVFTV